MARPRFARPKKKHPSSGKPQVVDQGKQSPLPRKLTTPGNIGEVIFRKDFHKPVSISSHPLIPMGFTSISTGEAEAGALFVSHDFYIVCEKKPLSLTHVASLSVGKGWQATPIDTLYSASVYYKKSKNPIGPSKLPIHVFSLMFSNTELGMKPRNLWQRITGKPHEPEMLFLMHYSSAGMKNLGTFDNDFDAETAYKMMIVKACEELVLHRNEFQVLGDLRQFGPDSPALR